MGRFAYLLILVSLPSWAQLQSPYSFGGACPSQGAWTQAVLSHANVISGVVEQLKNDANCSAVSTALQTYYTDIKANQNLNGNQGTSNFSELSGQILSLAGVLSTTNIQQTTLSNALASKTADVQTESAPLIPRSDATSTLSLKQRTFNTVNSGLDSLIRMSDSIQQNQRCLLNHGDQFGQLLSGAVYTLSAFVAGGDNASGARIAQAISSISTIFKNGAYNKVLAKLDQERFNNSIRCLMEITSESYCTIKDNLELLNLNVKSVGLKLKDQTEIAPDTDSPKTPLEIRKVVTNPFAGIYVMSQHIPNLNRYFQKILTGNDPSDKYESARRNDIEDDRNAFTKARTSLKGTLAQGRIDIKAQTAITSKRNELAKLINLLVDRMSSSNHGARGADDNKNFFEMVAPSNEIPFLLLGIPREQYPCRVYNVSLCPEKNAIAIDFESWITNGAATADGDWAFMKDPDQLIEKISSNLEDMISAAEGGFNIYYGTWFLPDKTSIIEQAFIGRPSIYDSLYATTKYLEDFEKRAKALGYQRAPIKLSMDTRRRINSALKALYDYNKRGDIGNDLDEVRDLAAHSVLELYRLFNLQQSRTTLLTDRLQKIVTADYRMMLDSGVDFSDYQKKLLYVLGENVASEMSNLAGKPWQQLQSDLMNASFMAKKNIEAVELIFADPLMKSIAETKLVARNLQPGRSEINFDSRARLRNDSSWLKNGTDDSTATRVLKDTVRTVDPISFVWRQYNAFWHGDRYRFSRFSLSEESSSPDSTFGAAAYITAQMCIQSLAFNNWKDFQSLCQGAVLPSVFNSDASILKPDELDALNSTYDKVSVKDMANPSLNHDDRICAFRDYYRNNYIFQLAIGLQGGSQDRRLVPPPTDLVPVAPSSATNQLQAPPASP